MRWILRALGWRTLHRARGGRGFHRLVHALLTAFPQGLWKTRGAEEKSGTAAAWACWLTVRPAYAFVPGPFEAPRSGARRSPLPELGQPARGDEA